MECFSNRMLYLKLGKNFFYCILLFLYSVFMLHIVFEVFNFALDV